MYWEICGDWCHGSGGSFADAARDNSKGYYLARRDTVGEPSSFSSRVSSVMRRLYVRACEKTMLSLHLGEWLK